MNSPFPYKLAQTSDGSHTLKLIGHDEQYHSLNGALQESGHVFIQSGLMALEPTLNPIHVLEIGMGTGLNALLTAKHALENKTRMIYDALEPYPIGWETAQKLNYPSFFADVDMLPVFQAIHQTGENDYEHIASYFSIRHHAQKLQDFLPEAGKYHLVYFDAFGPDTQPEMWKPEMFEKVFSGMKPGGYLVTYCVKGAVRRAMKAAGFLVEKLPGPAGKREISRATKP